MTTTSETTSPQVVETRPLAFLDGARGLAALSVCVFHAYLFTGTVGSTDQDIPWASWLFGYGYLGVPVFIVLSGYVLTLPVIRSSPPHFPGGVFRFLKRRARRILPPYYAALLLSLILIGVIPALSRASGTAWEGKVPVSVGGVVSHFLLVHDFSLQWVNQINGPLWSVAVEWHIYFLMPFVLIPLWRRFNPSVVVAATLLVTTAAGVAGVMPWAHPWLVGLFACGMLAAKASLDTRRPRALEVSAIASSVVLAAALISLKHLLQEKVWFTEIITGVVVALILAWLGSERETRAKARISKLLAWSPLMALGGFSYSLYLIHSPILAAINLLTLQLPLSTGLRLLMMLCIAVPASVVAGWAFFHLIERHFLNSRQKATRTNVQA